MTSFSQRSYKMIDINFNLGRVTVHFFKNYPLENYPLQEKLHWNVLQKVYHKDIRWLAVNLVSVARLETSNPVLEFPRDCSTSTFCITEKHNVRRDKERGENFYHEVSGAGPLSLSDRTSVRTLRYPRTHLEHQELRTHGERRGGKFIPRRSIDFKLYRLRPE